MAKDVNVKEFGIEDMTLAPPLAGTCPECAVNHDPAMPHNAQSLYYQYKFRQKNGRWPTWNDAMAHCTGEVRALWIQALAKHGVIVEAQPQK